MIALAAGSICAVVALVAYEAFATVQDRRKVQAVLAALDDYDETDVRRRELAVPVSQRLLAPLARTLVAFSRNALLTGYLERARHKLVVAGRPGTDELDRFRAIRVLTIALVPVAFAVSAVAPLEGRGRLVLFLFLTAMLVLGPDAMLNREMEARRAAIRAHLPDVIDLLTISVEAGLGFDQALERTVRTVPGPLSEEFRRLLGELRAGANRAEAFRAVDERTDLPELRSFLLAVIQADTFGVSIGRILRSQADEQRVKRRQQAQEAAQKAPVKLLFPMIFCIFPGLFVVLLGPALLTYLSSGF